MNIKIKLFNTNCCSLTIKSNYDSDLVHFLVLWKINCMPYPLALNFRVYNSLIHINMNNLFSQVDCKLSEGRKSMACFLCILVTLPQC